MILRRKDGLEGLRRLRREVQQLMLEVRLSDLEESELRAIVDVLGEALLRRHGGVSEPDGSIER